MLRQREFGGRAGSIRKKPRARRSWSEKTREYDCENTHELSIYANVGRDKRIKPTVADDHRDHGERPIAALLTFMAPGDTVRITTLVIAHDPLLKESASQTRNTSYSPNRDMQISTLTDATPRSEKRNDEIRGC